MRRLVVLLSLVVAAFAAGALAAVLLVDREAATRALVRALVRDLGVEVAVDGPVGLDLLPRPQLSLARVRIAAPAVSGRVDRIDVALDLASLLRLDPRPASVRLVRPDLVLEASAAPPAPPHIELAVLDGRLSLRHPRGPLVVEGLEAAWSLRPQGGFAFEARGRIAGRPAVLRGSGEERPGRTAVDLALELGRGGRLLRLRFRGDLPRASPAALSGEMRIALDDPPELARERALLALLPVTGPDLLLARLAAPLTVAARIRGEAGAFVLAPLGIAVGDLALSGSGRLEPGDRPHLSLELAATALALEGGQPLAALAGLRGLALDLHLTAGHARIGPLPLDEPDLRLRLSPDGTLALERLRAKVPGGGELEASAGMPPGGEIELRAALLVERPDALLRALAPELRLPVEVARRPATLEAGCRLDTDLRLRACSRLLLQGGPGRFEGRLAVDPGSGSPMLAGRLDRLEPGPWLALPSDVRAAWVRRLAPLAFELGIRRFALGGLHAGEVVARGALAADGRLVLERVRAGEVAGGRAELAGELDAAGTRLHLAGRAEVPVPVRLWRMLAGDPPPWLALFDATTLDFALDREGKSHMLRLRAETEHLTLAFEAREDAAGRTRALALEAPAAGPLLVRLGVPPAEPEAWRGALRVVWREQRDADGLVRLEAEAAGPVPPLRLLLARRPDGTLAGTLAGEAPPSLAALETLWLAAARLLPLPPTPPTAWPGAWPGVRLDAGALRALPPLDVAVRLGGGLQARLVAREGALAVEDLRLSHPALDLSGRIGLRAVEDEVAAEAALGVRLARIGAWPRLSRLFQRVDGRLELQADLRARGADVRALVAGLEGRAEIALAQGRVGDLAYDPKTRAFRFAPGEALALGPVGASCELAGGIARCRAPLVPLGDAGAFDLDAEVDLAAFTAYLRLRPAGGGPELVLSGPLGALAPSSARRAQSEGPSMRSGRTMASNSSAVR